MKAPGALSGLSLFPICHPERSRGIPYDELAPELRHHYLGYKRFSDHPATMNP